MANGSQWRLERREFLKLDDLHCQAAELFCSQSWIINDGDVDDETWDGNVSYDVI